MKTRNFTLLVSAIFLVIATFATSNSQVFAQSPCIAQVSYPAISSSYNPNIGMTVPVSATCSGYSGQLFAVGDAYDTTTNSDLGSVNTGLSSAGNGNFNGQLNFYLPTTVQGDTVQISVSLYNTAFGNNGSLLATTSQAITINGGYNQSYQNSYSYNNYNNSYSSCQPGYSYVGGSCYPPNNNNTSNYNNGYCSPGNSYVEANCYPPSYSSNYNNYNNSYSYCQPGYSYVGGSCNPPNNNNASYYNNGYPNNYNNYSNYNNYYAYCPPGYSYIGGSCSFPGYYYYSIYRYHGNYYYHWYYRHRHW
ncbi:MAG TPA: hypothetical protein VJZ32_08215 [Candidatus Bathyarchaeia archaeon]|nr:hypothetical protein [Candidatus Bathyarchaeia archaeon]